MTVDWLSAREAAAQLDVKLATLYAYASRGLIESVPASDGRGRRYARDSIDRLKARHDARAGHGPVAASALRWGEPSLETSISEIREDGPAYRGHALPELLREAPSFESVTALLWSGTRSDERWTERVPRVSVPARGEASPLAFFAAALANAALRDDARHGASDADEHVRARGLLRWIASRAGVAVRPQGSLAETVLASYRVRATRAAVHAVDRALILCADHELNPSTFAVRVTASTGADLYACLCTGLAALSGPKHGGVTRRVEALLQEIRGPERAAAVMRARLARGEQVPGFGHPLYERGDPRATALLALAQGVRSSRTSVADALLRAMSRARQPAPSLDLGLVVLARALGLPEGSAAALFTLGRIAGWTAHALEQRAQGYLLRPRARYVPSPEPPGGR